MKVAKKNSERSRQSGLSNLNRAQRREVSSERSQFPSALTVIKAIACGGYLKGHPDHLTRKQMIDLAQAFLQSQKI